MINRQQGFTLLEVMAALAIFSMLSVLAFMIFSQASELHQRSQKEIQQFNQLQRTITMLASLTQDVKDNDRQTTLQQYWAQPQQLQLEDGNTVKWQLRDAQHCFNLNALAKISDDPLASPDFPAQVFSALLINAGIDRGNTDEIVQSIADYIDVDDSPRFHGAEDSFYQSQTPPRHSANQMLFLTGELRQIKGITENIYQRLIPYVCVLPTTELSINLNMLTENDIPLFRALFLNNITDADARVLLQKRPREGWLTTDAFLYWAQQDFSGVKPLVAQVKRHLFPYSRYFTLSTESISDEQSQGWQSHIFFNRKQQSAQIYRRTLQLY
ncbi:general secretion pathway protein GspK [Escherichia coli]|uniref:type II secretion system minor pseudopilin GspK n=1 Tax=Escherichia coli TaxID=562 RepID=UPI00128EE818|nr:type II secretion system minor pseudopilin GspK [Escherichia coli]MQI07569.1 general secretion pathway protein GspK [Escherichia coli]MQK74137.1 general secretion pathway protein GspK [Escherichia coli]HBB9010383.1 type II secretion system minor pseudopilin GspK [Escherichia coli]